jgi:hypothetical protein
MGNFYHIEIEIVICKDGTSHWGNANHPFADIKLVNNFRYEPVNNAVPASGTVTHTGLFEAFRPLEYLSHR